VWWAGSKTCDVYIGTRGFAACHDAEVLRVQSVNGTEHALATLAEWLDQAASFERLNVWLSGGLCRPVYLKPVHGVRTQSDWKRIAQSTVVSQAGLAEPCEVWVERRSIHSAGRMAAAVPQALLRRVLETAGKPATRRRIARIAPWWSEALRLNSLSPSAASFPVLAVQDCDSIAMFVGQGNEFVSATSYTPMTDDETARATLARALMSTDTGDASPRLVKLQLAEGRCDGAGALGSLTEWSR
jgi:hypothetical protein